jgi:glutamine amidotransferase
MEQGLTVVIDYGMGNLGSITKALAFVGGEVLLSDKPEDLRRAARIVLPGVGAFGDGMKNLHARGFVPALEEEVQKNKKPFLGVCLGMQLLAKRSDEFGEHTGLGFLDAEVQKMSVPPPLKIPHVGWNTVVWLGEHPLLAGVPKQSDFYFVHSYHMVPKDAAASIGTTDYGGSVVAAIAWDNMFATQFHPEKSQKDGLKLLENFLAWRP